MNLFRASAVGPICIIAIGLFAFWPLLNGGFFHDDWHFFALFRHIDSYAAIFNSNFAISHFYRPLGLAFTAITFELFDLNHRAHFAINIALHLWVGFLVARLALALGANQLTSLAAGVLFAFFPLSAATPTWTANRFDLLATGATLAALIASLRFRRSNSALGYAILCAWIALAIGSKETGFIAALGASLFLALHVRSGGTISIQWLAILGVCAIVAGALILRVLAIGAIVDDWQIRQPGASFPGSFVAQLQALWFATWQIKFPVAIAVGVISAFFLTRILLSRRAELADRRETFSILSPRSATPFVSVIVLALLAATTLVLQGAVAGQLFSTHPERAVGAELRFFYMPLALGSATCAIVISAFGTSAGTVNFARFKWIVLLTICAAFAFTTRTQNINAAERGERAREVLSTANSTFMQQAAAAPGNRYCMIETNASDFGPHDAALDVAIKAHLRSADSAVNCVLISDPPQFIAITRRAPCDQSAHGAYMMSGAGIAPIPRAGTCTFVSPTRAR